jgi:hypothetical protein
MLPKSVALSPSSVVGGGSVTGTVALQCPAGPGDILVTLSSSHPSVATPAAVNGMTRVRTLTVNPAP